MSSSLTANSAQPDFNFTDYYALASWLYDTRQTPPSSALKRTVISRAYYAALICARDQTCTSTTGPQGHKTVVDALRAIDSRAGNNLDDLRLLRHRADYDPHQPVSERDMQKSLKSASVVLQFLRKMQTGSKPYSSDFLDPTKFISSE